MAVKLNEVELHEICRQITDGTHDSPKLQKHGVPFIKGKHISSGRIDYENCDFITYEDHLKVIARSKPEKGDILFSNIGSVGDTAYVNENIEFSIKNVALLKPDPRKVVSLYLYYLVCSPSFHDGLLQKRSGAAQPFISLDVLRHHAIKYHADLPTQRKIAAILSAYDDLIENNLRRIKLLEEMAQRLYREWFVHFRFPGHEKVRMVDSPLGPIPEGWEVVELGDIAEEIRDNVPKGALALLTPYVGLEHIPRQSLALTEWEMVDELGSNKLRFTQGDVLFGKIRPYFHKVIVAPVDGVCSADSFVVHAIDAADYALVVATMFSTDLVAHATATSNGAKMPRANWSVLQKYQIPYPPGELKGRFQAFLESVIEQQRVFVLTNRVLRETRNLLLPRLISGELDVSELDIQVPESDSIPEPPPLPVTDLQVTPKKESTGIVRKPQTPVVKPPPSSDFETNDIIAAIRQAFGSAIRLEREDLLKATSLELGYARMGKRVAKAIAGGINAAIRRGVLKDEAGCQWLTASNLQSQDREVLIVAITSSMRKNGIMAEEDLMRQVLVHLGFQRLTAPATEAMKGAIRTAIRRGILEREGDFLRRKK